MDISILRECVCNFVDDAKENDLPGYPGERIFDLPVLGFAGIFDPLFIEYKRIIGDFHLTPVEWLNRSFPRDKIKEGTVISWILPFSESVKESNRKMSDYPSEKWVKAKIFGENLNDEFRHYIVDLLLEEGYNTVSPSLLNLFHKTRYDKIERASNWSERHIAYACGLGTFSLSDGFITEKGIAVRVGSAITKLVLPPTKRKYENHKELCLNYSKGGCGACIKRCPVKAISKSGHDKLKCEEFVNIRSYEYAKRNFGLNDGACGLCQTGVPCESKKPEGKPPK